MCFSLSLCIKPRGLGPARAAVELLLGAQQPPEGGGGVSPADTAHDSCIYQSLS